MELKSRSKKDIPESRDVVKLDMMEIRHAMAVNQICH